MDAAQAETISRPSFTMAAEERMMFLPAEKLTIPQASQTKEENQNYGRPITEIQPEEGNTETVQGRQRCKHEKAGRGRQTGCK
jgi:hypothetical protein